MGTKEEDNEGTGVGFTPVAMQGRETGAVPSRDGEREAFS